MPTIFLSDGVDETEPTLISDSAMQDCDGAEYRVGQIGPFVARGRNSWGSVAGSTTIGLYEAGFDEADFIVAHAGNSYSASSIDVSGLSFVPTLDLASGSSPITGGHYGNRHYVASGVQNARLEYAASGVTAFPIGMSRSTLTIGVSVTQGAGALSAATGVVYWVTEYDSARGIESMTGSSVSTGAFSGKDGVYGYVTGVSANPRADQLRWYRSVDGGGFPDAGLIATTAIGTTFHLDQLVDNGTLTVPQYGLISVGGLDTERDEPPPVLAHIFGPFQDSMLGVSVDEPRVLRFTPAGYPDSWPSRYGVPLETHRHDEIIAGVVLSGRIGVFCKDSVHVIYRLPRDSDSVFAAGEAQDMVTDQRGCVSRRGACVVTPPNNAPIALWVSRDGIWAGSLATSPSPVTDKTDWAGRVDASELSSCRLVDDPANRRAVFLYRRMSDSTYSTGVWYIDYQEYEQRGLRVTYADHGPLSDAVTIPYPDGTRKLASCDSRSGNGSVYLESVQDVDDSLLRDADGSVRFRARTKEYMPAGASGTAKLGKATWMHGAGPSVIRHRFYHNRRDSNPETKTLDQPTIRTADAVQLGRDVNSFSLEIESCGTVSYGLHWLDLEDFEKKYLGGQRGA